MRQDDASNDWATKHVNNTLLAVMTATNQTALPSDSLLTVLNKRRNPCCQTHAGCHGSQWPRWYIGVFTKQSGVVSAWAPPTPRSTPRHKHGNGRRGNSILKSPRWAFSLLNILITVETTANIIGLNTANTIATGVLFSPPSCHFLFYKGKSFQRRK